VADLDRIEALEHDLRELRAQYKRDLAAMTGAFERAVLALVNAQTAQTQKDRALCAAVEKIARDVKAFQKRG
jgi:hypothetical protein